MEFLFEHHARAIPIRALHLVDATLSGLQSTIDVSPEEVDEVRNAIISICKDVTSEYSRLTGPLISNKTFATRLRLEANITHNIILESELRALAILIDESL